MNRAFKCPKCSNIQLKGTRCVDDGTELIECDLDIENEENSEPFVSVDNQNQDDEFIRNIRNACDLINPM